jgi:hypothetical protein
MGEHQLSEAAAGHFIAGASRQLCQVPEHELHSISYDVWLYDGPNPRRSTPRCDECLTRRALQRHPRWMWPFIRLSRKRRGSVSDPVNRDRL